MSAKVRSELKKKGNQITEILFKKRRSDKGLKSPKKMYFLIANSFF
jgi:hypothetical protein